VLVQEKASPAPTVGGSSRRNRASVSCAALVAALAAGVAASSNVSAQWPGPAPTGPRTHFRVAALADWKTPVL
jgi:hypothetical protein